MRKKIKLKQVKEERGNLAFEVVWISAGNVLSRCQYDTEKEARFQVVWLKNLEIKGISVYRRWEY